MFEPATKLMNFELVSNPDGTIKSEYIDLSQCASILNRRFYRQGLNWVVGGFTFVGAANNELDPTQPKNGYNGEMLISKIPDNWISANSWVKGFKAWNKLNFQTLEEAQSLKAKFTDFKVYMDKGHHDLGSAANLIPKSDPVGDIPGGMTYVAGEWIYSKLVIPDFATPGTSDNFEIIWTGANNNVSPVTTLTSKSLIEGYASSRSLPDILDPNRPDDARDYSQNWLLAMFNEGTTQDEQVMTDLTVENNIAPYPFENDGVNPDTMYPGGQNQAPGTELHGFTQMTATTISNITHLEGSNFQGGLIKISHKVHPIGESNGEPIYGQRTFNMFVHLVPGPHRGYLAQNMEDL